MDQAPSRFHALARTATLYPIAAPEYFPRSGGSWCSSRNCTITPRAAPAEDATQRECVKIYRHGRELVEDATPRSFTRKASPPVDRTTALSHGATISISPPMQTT